MIRICRFLAILTACAAALFAADWKAVEPAELAAKEPVVEKTSDAEAIFWDVWVTDELDGGELHTVLDHYLRIKVFTERGVETQGKVDLLSGGRIKISEIAGRTIKADGSIVELEKSSIFDRVLVQAEGMKVSAKSFAMPGLEPGAIIEYRWREVRADQVANYIRLEFQRDIPVQRVTYHVKPLSLRGVALGMNSIRFHMPDVPWTKERGGYSAASFTNMPAFRREPDMPPDNQVRAWVLIYYTLRNNSTPAKYWQDFGREWYRTHKAEMKVDGEVKSTAAKAIAGAQTDEEKIKRLYDYCHTEIKNRSDRATELTAEERAALKANKTPADTLKQGVGSSRDIDMLFGAMANAVGFDARYALLADRSDIYFSPELGDSYFLSAHAVAIQVQDKWQFFHPGSAVLPYGSLAWQQEGAEALIPDAKEPFFVKVPISPADKTAARRKATFKLDAKGTLEGDVIAEYTGHNARARRRALAGETVEQQKSSVSKSVKAWFKSATVTEVKLQNVEELEKPLIESYHIRVTNYAQRTGKRLLLPIAFFQRNQTARFPTSERRHPVAFHYPWLEEDSLSFDLPEGFEMENADAPAPIPFAPVGEYNVKASVTRDKRKILYSRTLKFGNNGQIYFEPKAYPSLKKVFDGIHDQDQHVIGLKSVEAAK